MIFDDFIIAAQVKFRGYGKDLEIVSVGDIVYLSGDWEEEEVTVRGLMKRFKARIYRDGNMLFINVEDIEKAGEEEIWLW